MNKSALLGGFVLALLLPGVARAQNFIPNGGAIAFAPQISIVNSGALLDVQGTVSADRKYVTITERPQLSTLIGLQTFAFQTQNPSSGSTQGQTQGGRTPSGGVPSVIAPGANQPVLNPAIVVGAGAGSALAQRGMTPIRLQQ